jgi:hypothetical protein
MLRASKYPVQKNFNPSNYARSEYQRGYVKYPMSRSELVRFAKCPRKWLLGGFDKESTGAMNHGSLVDCLLLTPDLYELSYEVTPETYQISVLKCSSCGSITDSKMCRKCKAERESVTIEKPWILAADYCKEWEARVAALGKTPIQSVQLNSANAAIRRLREDSSITQLLSQSDFQVFVPVEWHDDSTGIVVPVKCLIDIAPKIGTEFGSCLADLKTTKDATLRDWTRDVFYNGYHVQSSLYIDAYNAHTSEGRNQFRFIVSENVTPFECCKRWLSEEFLDIGRQTYRFLLAAYCQCLANNHFPGYDEWQSETVVSGWGCVSPEPFMVLQQ